MSSRQKTTNSLKETPITLSNLFDHKKLTLNISHKVIIYNLLEENIV